MGPGRVIIEPSQPLLLLSKGNGAYVGALQDFPASVLHMQCITRQFDTIDSKGACV
eukprot:SAG31_NODE_1672_length_7564_cov_10.193704_7_plen_56_part_00